MRTLTTPTNRRDTTKLDQGTVLVLVAVLLVALIGVTALVVDIGALAVEKREVQNGADAAALAVAQDCAGGNCGAASTTAVTYLTLNAEEDANSSLDLICGVGPGLTACSGGAPSGVANATGWVRVDGGAPVDYVLAPVMGPLAGRAEADAIAAWGPLGAAATAPLAFSICEFIELGGSIATHTFPSGQNYIYFHGVGGTNEPGVGSCTPSPSGQDLPGGFGWVATTQGTCTTPTLTAGQWVHAGTGNSVPSGCNLSAWRNQEVLITIFDDERGTGANGEYHIAGFVGFRVLGYRFPGNANRWPNGFQCPEGSGNSASCIRGEFTRVTNSTGEFGGGSDFGASVVKLVG
jgi:Putative Flp pilus-assembly TadE/G-like